MKTALFEARSRQFSLPNHSFTLYAETFEYIVKIFLLHVISWKWICSRWQIRSIGCRSPWKSRTKHRTIDDMMVQCLVAGDLEALIFCYRWSLCEQHYALIETSGPHRSVFIMSLPLPVKSSATYDQQEMFTLPCQVASEYAYVYECICTCACICVHIYKCMHMYICNKCVIENTAYGYIYDKIQCGQSSPNILTTGTPWLASRARYGVSFVS